MNSIIEQFIKEHHSELIEYKPILRELSDYLTANGYEIVKKEEGESFDSFFAGLSAEDEHRAMELYKAKYPTPETPVKKECSHKDWVCIGKGLKRNDGLICKCDCPRCFRDPETPTLPEKFGFHMNIKEIRTCDVADIVAVALAEEINVVRKKINEIIDYLAKK